MNAHKVEIGERYGDDSGWQRRVMIDKQADRVEIELCGSEMSLKCSELTWVIEALCKARSLVNVP